MLLAGHADVAIAELDRPDGGFEVAVVEHLRLKVPAEARQAWIDAEKGSWEPWLAQQDGFLDRQLLWDPTTEEGTLLIRWASRDQWKAIPEQDLEAVQERFEQLARQATGAQQGNPFPLVFEGELLPP
ncbi:TIGR03792 family protein [Cyanobium sp. Aljojuca 7D2]|nr:TIGR03792 family protein [Cyanobium sp. Aljojuca 7D2]